MSEDRAPYSPAIPMTPAVLLDSHNGPAAATGMKPICGIISNSGPNGEPLACGYLPGHEGAHAWATLPTWNTRAGEV